MALKYYRSLKSVRIEPWVKKRYQLIGLGSLIYGLSVFLYYLIPYDVIGAFAFPNIIFSYIILGFTIFYSLCMFFAWIMPNKLKKYFNRSFEETTEKEYTEKELLDHINKQLDSNP